MENSIDFKRIVFINKKKRKKNEYSSIMKPVETTAVLKMKQK